MRSEINVSSYVDTVYAGLLANLLVNLCRECERYASHGEPVPRRLVDHCDDVLSNLDGVLWDIVARESKKDGGDHVGGDTENQ